MELGNTHHSEWLLKNVGSSGTLDGKFVLLLTVRPCLKWQYNLEATYILAEFCWTLVAVS